jgi:hypothetical protein
VGHIFLDASGGFDDYNNDQDEYEALFDDLTWGWQGGLGLDFWKLHIDLRYEGNFRQLGEEITFFGRTFDFDTADNRMIASLGFSF